MAARSSDSGSIIPGTVIGGAYRVVEPIGSGGFADVYRAVDETLDRQVAIKVARRDALDTPSFRRRFAAEGVVCARLDHPNVVSVFGAGNHGDVPYLVMEYLSRGSLRDNLADPETKVGHAVGWLQSALAGLSAAHRAGIVHGDVKPSNILLGDAAGKPRVKLIDFGAASFGAARGRRTLLWGTPEYMAPELAGGARPEPRSDIYSMGVVLYELLTGAPPFVASSSAEVFRLHAECPLPELDLGRLSPLMEVARTALAKDPALRYPSAADLQRDLSAAMPALRRASRRPTRSLLVTEPANSERTPSGPITEVSSPAGRKRARARSNSGLEATGG